MAGRLRRPAAAQRTPVAARRTPAAARKELRQSCDPCAGTGSSSVRQAVLRKAGLRLRCQGWRREGAGCCREAPPAESWWREKARLPEAVAAKGPPAAANGAAARRTPAAARRTRAVARRVPAAARRTRLPESRLRTEVRPEPARSHLCCRRACSPLAKRAAAEKAPACGADPGCGRAGEARAALAPRRCGAGTQKAGAGAQKAGEPSPGAKVPLGSGGGPSAFLESQRHSSNRASTTLVR